MLDLVSWNAHSTVFSSNSVTRLQLILTFSLKAQTHCTLFTLLSINSSIHVDNCQHLDQWELKAQTHCTWFTSLSAQCISSIGQIIKSLCVSVSQSVSELSHKTSWTLYRSQSSTDLHQTCHQRRVPGGVFTYCFWWKSEIFLSAKPEVELILTIDPMEKYL